MQIVHCHTGETRHSKGDDGFSDREGKFEGRCWWKQKISRNFVPHLERSECVPAVS